MSSRDTLETEHKSVRELAFFLLSFAAFWILAVVVIWKLGLVPEPLRKWPRNAIWLGASLVWIARRRPPSATQWLGLRPISLRQLSLTVAGFVSILGWNWLR